MTVEELITELQKHPGHYTAHIFREGYELEDFVAQIIAVDCQSEIKAVDIVIEWPGKFRAAIAKATGKP